MSDRNPFTKLNSLVVIAIVGFTSMLFSAQTVFSQTAGVRDGLESVPQDGDMSLVDILVRVINVLLFFVGAFSTLMLVIGAVRYVVSAGDQNAVQNARNTILYAIVGLVLAFISFAAVNFVVRELTEEDPGVGVPSDCSSLPC